MAAILFLGPSGFGRASVGRTILLSYLPPEYAHEGTALSVEYFGERYPVTVAVVGNTPLFDPHNERMK